MLSLLGGVVVIRKSPRSLFRLRRPTTDNGDVLEILSRPVNDCGRLLKKSVTNWETLPDAGTVTDAAEAADVPSRLNNCRFTVTWFADEFAIATAVCMEPIAPGIPEDSTYMRNAVP